MIIHYHLLLSLILHSLLLQLKSHDIVEMIVAFNDAILVKTVIAKSKRMLLRYTLRCEMTLRSHCSRHNNCNFLLFLKTEKCNLHGLIKEFWLA